MDNENEQSGSTSRDGNGDEKIIPATPNDDDYAREADAQSDIEGSDGGEAFAVDDDQGEVFTEKDPIELFRSWLALAGKHEVNDPNAMALATVDRAGMPNVRMVLLKDVGARGFTFYSNAESVKGLELEGTPKAALCFHWKSIRRQVRVRGTVEALSPEESDEYFASRSRGSQLGAIASFQSRVVDERETLERRIEDYDAIYKDRDIPRPDNWHGFLIQPTEIEFWVNRPYRLHDRKQFTLAKSGWKSVNLYP